jgi:hypothetical protein
MSMQEDDSNWEIGSILFVQAQESLLLVFIDSSSTYARIQDYQSPVKCWQICKLHLMIMIMIIMMIMVVNT